MAKELLFGREAKDFPKTTFLPFGPSVTLTVFANLSTPAPSAALASEPYLISFAMIKMPPKLDFTDFTQTI